MLARNLLILTCRSSFHMRLSNGNDSLNFSMSGSVAPVNRPPQSFLSAGLWLFSLSETAAYKAKYAATSASTTLSTSMSLGSSRSRICVSHRSHFACMRHLSSLKSESDFSVLGRSCLQSYECGRSMALQHQLSDCLGMLSSESFAPLDWYAGRQGCTGLLASGISGVACPSAARFCDRGRIPSFEGSTIQGSHSPLHRGSRDAGCYSLSRCLDQLRD